MSLKLKDGICNRCGTFGPQSAGCSHSSCGGIFVARKKEKIKFRMIFFWGTIQEHQERGGIMCPDFLGRQDKPEVTRDRWRKSTGMKDWPVCGVYRDSLRDENDIVPGSLEARVFEVTDSYMVFDSALSIEQIYKMITYMDPLERENKEEVLKAIEFWRSCR